MLEGMQRIHLIGIGGAGMRAIANILIHQGYTVSGSDLNRTPIIERFESLGATIYMGQDASHVEGADVVVISTAIQDDNPELVAAKAKGLPILHRSDIVKHVLEHSKGIAVAGAHGKTTTTSMIGQIFEEAALDPTIIIGGEVDYLQGNSKLGQGTYSVVEADESDGSFLRLRPHIAVITNIENDHMDYYKTRENLIRAFDEFVEHLPESDGFAVVCGDNDVLYDMAQRINRQFITYGIEQETLDYRAINIRYEDGWLRYDVEHEGTILITLTLQVPGNHNVLNSLGAYVTAKRLGVADEPIVAALKKFKGAKRRFETKGRCDGVWVVDDYAHHPTEIAATLSAAKALADYRVVCVFQPHRYTRTQLLLDEFSTAFKDADLVVLTDIYSAGEAPIPNIDVSTIPNALKKTPNQEVMIVPNVDDVPGQLQHLLRPNDLVITMGAGNINQYGPKLLALLQKEAEA